MTQLKPNSEVIKSALKGERGRYSIKGHAGLALHTRGDGNGSWLVRYRVNDKQHWHTLHNDARRAVVAEIIDAKDKWLANVKLGGVDPKCDIEKKRQVAGAEQRTITDVFSAWLNHTGKRRGGKAIAPTTRRNYEAVFKLHVEPHIGATPISQLDRKLVQQTIREVLDATVDPERGFRGTQATKVLKLLNSLAEWSIDQEWIGHNPCRGIEYPAPIAHPEGKQHRPPTNDELRQLWNDGPKLLTPVQMRLVRLGILTGRRISEIAGAERKDVQLDQSIPCLFIPAQREGNKPKRDDAVPLAPMALAIITEAVAASKDEVLIFNGAVTRWTTSKAVTMLRKLWNWPEPAVRFHDFRGLINDQMAALGVPTELRSRTLHHTGDLQQLANTVYSAYDFMADRLKALELWEARLTEIINGAKPSGLRWH
jgi:integrase